MLCIECLNRGINQAVRVRKWKLIRLGCKGILITHLFFTDDLILLAEASREQATVINNDLATFCMSLGEQVNKTKTQSFSLGILLQGRLARLDRTWVLLSQRIWANTWGMPVLHSRVGKSTYQAILDKVEQRLSGRNALNLSLVGRITVTQLVLQVIPVYAMQTTKLPASVHVKIDQICAVLFGVVKRMIGKSVLLNGAIFVFPKIMAV